MTAYVSGLFCSSKRSSKRAWQNSRVIFTFKLHNVDTQHGGSTEHREFLANDVIVTIYKLDLLCSVEPASLVQSRLDYANSTMYGMSASNMHKLQSVQNSLTCVVLPSLRHLSACERHCYLHWLSVHYRIQFKIATLTYKTLTTCQPSYLYNLLQLHQRSLALRSSTQQLLQ